MRFSTASTIPSVVQTPTAVDPSCRRFRFVYTGLQIASLSRAAQERLDGTAHLDCLYSIFNLKQSAFRAKCVHSTIVFRSGQKHVAGPRKVSGSETDQALAHTTTLQQQTM